MAWMLTFTGSHLAMVAGGNSITKNQMASMTGMMVASTGAMHLMNVALMVNHGPWISPQEQLKALLCNSILMSVTAWWMNALLSKSITQIGGIPAITTKTVNGMDTHTTQMAWVLTFTGSNLVMAAGGNLTTKSKMAPTTGMMVVSTGAIHGMVAMMAATIKNHAQSSSMVIMEVVTFEVVPCADATIAAGVLNKSSYSTTTIFSGVAVAASGIAAAGYIAKQRVEAPFKNALYA